MKTILKTKNMYKTRIFISILAVSIVPILILAGFSYKTYIAQVSNKIDMTADATLVQLSTRVENVMDSIRAYYAEIDSDSRFLWLNNAQLNQGYVDYTYLGKVADLFRGPVYLRDYVDGFIYVDRAQGYLFTNAGIVPISEAANFKEVEEVLKIDNRSMIYWKNNLDIPTSIMLGKDDEIATGGYLMILKIPNQGNGMENDLIIRFHTWRLHTLISQGLGDFDAVVFDGAGKLLYGTNEELSNYSISNLELFQNNKAIFSARLLEGDKFRIASAVSQTSGLHYIVGYNQTVVQEGAQKIVSLSFILLGIFTCVILVMMLGTKLIYQPVHSLRKEFSLYVDAEATLDEFSFFRKGIEALANSRNSLELVVKSQKRQLLNLFMTRMIQGELSLEKINQNLKEFHLEPRRFYQILAIQIKYEDNEMKEEQDITQSDAFRMAIIQNMPDKIMDVLFLPPISLADSIIFIAGTNSDEEKLQIQQIHYSIRIFIEEQYPCMIISGASQIFQELTHIRIAFNESIEAIKSNHIGEDKVDFSTDITFYGDLTNAREKKYEYDILLEKAVYQAVDNRDYRLACQIMNQFVDGIMSKKISLRDRSYCLNRFLVTILRVATDAGLSMTQVFEIEQTNLFTCFNQICDEGKIRDFLDKKIITPTKEQLVQFRSSNSGHILDRVIELIKEKNGDITLSECAEQLNYHPSYIWKVLKTEKNMSFMDFIAMEKLEIAKDMLVNTDLTITQIAERLNYTNTQNFIRFFSKHEHISPGKYKANLNK